MADGTAQGDQGFSTGMPCSGKTQDDFLSLLRERGLYHYERNGRITGIEEEGAKFRFSRLFEAGLFEQLQNEQPEVDRVVDEIRAIRERQAERNRDEENLIR